MNENSLGDERQELVNLLEDVANRELDAEQMSRLSELLRDDPAARHQYLDHMCFEASVVGEFPPETLQEKSAPVQDSQRSSHPSVRLWFGVGIAACLSILALIVNARWQPETPKLGSNGESSRSLSPEWAPSKQSILALTLLKGAEVEVDGEALTENASIGRGVVKILKGNVEMSFYSGVVMRLDGPAEMEAESPYRIQMERGKASVYVPPQVDKFVVHTPSAFIRDYGTSFVVEVLEEGGTEVHVVDGMVTAAPVTRNGVGKAHKIRGAQALRLTDEGSIRVPFVKQHFSLEKTEGELPDHIHWSFDHWDGSRSKGSDGVHGIDYTRAGNPVEPELATGKHGKALRFDGRSRYAVSDFPGIGGSAERSVAFWVRVQPGASRETPNGMLSWGEYERSKKWQVAWNADLTRGELGAVRVEFGEGYVVGSTDLRDGQWHHLAVVFLGGFGKDVSTHVRMYVDGALEKVTYGRQNTIDTAVGSEDAEPLVLGKYLGVWAGRDPFYFEGLIDEVYVFDGILMPSQIMKLVRDPEGATNR